MIYFLIWLAGLYFVPRVVSKLEAGYGIVTVGTFLAWTVIMFLFWATN